MGAQVTNYDDYRHLNDCEGSCKAKVELTIPELYRMVDSCNYGMHRFLSELVKESETAPTSQRRKKLAQGIRALLDDGLY